MGQYTIKLVGNNVTLSDFNRKILDELDSIIFPNDVGCQKRHPNRVWWLVYAKRNPIGFAGMEIVNGEAFLCRVGILKDFRGKGIQKRLIRCREKYAKKNRVNDIITYVHIGNISSCNNLISCGYKMYNPCNHWAGTQRCETIYFCKRLK